MKRKAALSLSSASFGLRAIVAAATVLGTLSVSAPASAVVIHIEQVHFATMRGSCVARRHKCPDPVREVSHWEKLEGFRHE